MHNHEHHSPQDRKQRRMISIIVPVHDEQENIPLLYAEISREWQKGLMRDYDFEVLFVDDGSQDDSMKEILTLAKRHDNVRFIEFSRNFGKEIATTAGIHHCAGDACIMIDADLQHPVEALPEFIKKWEEGYEVVIGVRRRSKSDSFIKRWGGKIFYRLIRMISDVPIISHATDYRLMDRIVVDAFNELPERNRITRGLIDWLGFRRGLVYFDAKERSFGDASYGVYKLTKLAITSVISLSLLPLRLAGYLGVFIVIISAPLGLFMFLDRYIMGWGYAFTGSVILAVILMFLIGIVLVCIGLLAFYIGHIYHESQGRQMYIVRSQKPQKP